MATYYVREQGAVVRKQDERLVVTKDDDTVAEIPLHQLDQLVVMGNIQLTTPVVALLLKSAVDVVFMSLHGKVRGRLMANESKFAELRLKQLQVMSNDQANLALAKPIVIGKLINQRAFLLRGAPVKPLGRGQIDKSARGIAEMIERSKTTDNADSLRGFEGKAGAWYWPAFKTLLKNDMGFANRAYYPSTDPVNALLSFGYSLLQKDVTSAVQLVGLDPYLGFFHTVQYGRPSLALDLMEQFRPLVVDPLAVDLIARDEIGPQDFARGAEKARPVLLKEEAVKRVIQRYEERITSLVRYPLTGEQATYRRCIELQTRQLARVVKGEAAAYVPMTNGE
jgi:CRISPR-associated protein Cas1